MIDVEKKQPTILPQALRFATYEEFRSFQGSDADHSTAIYAFEEMIVSGDIFNIAGRCEVCDRESDFYVDYEYCMILSDGKRIPNWRERLICPHCNLNNRMRAAAAHILLSSKFRSNIYLTEATTPLFRAISSRRRNVIGSEYLDDEVKKRDAAARGIRHEDVTNLTFSDGSLDVIGTFDVLEHVPNYRRAMAELFRCLKPSGTLVLTVPINLSTQNTITRATVDEAGAITHLLPPEIHGDPLNGDGVLCFYNFGWDFIESLTEAGFKDAGAFVYWNPRLGYLGGYQCIIIAKKPEPRRFWSFVPRVFSG